MHQVSLVRIIGNDVPEIHSQDQSLKNLEYILKNEKNFLNCKKIFILNRIVNKNIEKEIIDQLKKHNIEYFIIPFQTKEFINLFNKNFKCLDKKLNLFNFEPEDSFALTETMSESIYFLTNVNKARNFGIEKGNIYSNTTLIFDGSCFMTEELYFDFLNNLNKTDKNDKAIFIFPMHRLSNYNQIKNKEKHNFWFEPQIGMKNIVLNFDNNKQWPEDKIEFLHRYGIEGYWDLWKEKNQKYESLDCLKIYCKGVFRLPTWTFFDIKNKNKKPDLNSIKNFGLIPGRNLFRKVGLIKLLTLAYSQSFIDKEG
jgi:hypothetical protein